MLIYVESSREVSEKELAAIRDSFRRSQEDYETPLKKKIRGLEKVTVTSEGTLLHIGKSPRNFRYETDVVKRKKAAACS